MICIPFFLNHLFIESIAKLNIDAKLLKIRGGKPNKLSIEDRLLMCLEYLREYRTYFHISRSYGISESACFRNVRWVENTLIKSGKFSLPGLKSLITEDVGYEVILIDRSKLLTSVANIFSNFRLF